MWRSLKCLIIRGGSSKGVFVPVEELPPPGAERDRIILDLFGSPDVRQIDGLGGADKLTSKLAIMGPSSRKDCVIDYLFGQVNIALPKIDWTSNCGNISAGAGFYAAYKGLGEPMAGGVRVAIHQVNTGRRLLATVPIEDGLPAFRGDFAIGGVPGTGARIDLDFADFAACILGKGVLPTGLALDRFDVPGLGNIEVSIVDCANLHFFVRAKDVGLDHTVDIVSLQNDPEVIARLERIRGTVAREIGFITGPNAAEELLVRMNPLLYVVGPPRDYTTLNGKQIATGAYDLFARSITRASFSKAYPGSGSIGTAVACGIAGTIPYEAAAGGSRRSGEPYKICFGHPSGTMEVAAEVAGGPGEPIAVRSAVVGRTARILMEGRAFLKW
jgi:2-methylaconitate cis-trans-isomerase PrpF